VGSTSATRKVSEMSARFYTCPDCGRLLVTANDAGSVKHDCPANEEGE
jgi:DNA-directed RNA polymerase subunit M/transcription elongation factor TFIIS